MRNLTDEEYQVLRCNCDADLGGRVNLAALVGDLMNRELAVWQWRDLMLFCVPTERGRIAVSCYEAAKAHEETLRRLAR